MPLALRGFGNRRFVTTVAAVVAIAAVCVIGAMQVGQTPTASPPWIYGQPDARFTVVLYADIKCPYCQQFIPFLRAWIDQHQEVKLEWRHFPLEAHEPDATQAAIAAECAGRLRGSAEFWNTAESLLAGGTPSLPATSDEFAACTKDQTVHQWVRAQATEAATRGILGTPTIQLFDAAGSESMTLPGIVDGDALLSAIDLLDSSAGNSH